MNRAQFHLTLLLSLALGSFVVSAHAMTEQTLFQQHKSGYKHIRIPTLCKTARGTLLAFAEGREAGDAGNIDTIMRRSEDGGQTWSTQQVIWTDASNTCGNASPVVDHDTGTIWLFNTWNLRVSYDEGRTWPLSQEVYQGGSAYSTLVKVNADTVGLFYEKDNYAKMVFVTFPPAKLESNDSR